MTDEQVGAFLVELTALTRKHRLEIVGGNWDGSMGLMPIEPDDKRMYRLNRGDLEFVEVEEVQP